MKCIINGSIITNGQRIDNKAICFDNKVIKIDSLEDIKATFNDVEIIDAKGAYIAPGFIDIHIHGSMGHDVCDADPEGLQIISKAIVKNGVTSYLPTTMTIPTGELHKVLDIIEEYKGEDTGGAEILGAHLEGPFINEALKGAQKGDHIKVPDYAFVHKHKEVIALITLAPEIQGAIEFIKNVKANTDIVLSMGHTNATYEEAMEGVDKGVSHATHTFNAMSKLHHRDPGTVGAALISDEVKCEVIADNVHLHPAIYKLLVKTKGIDKIILVTDCVQATGLPDGDYTLGGQKIKVKGKQSLLENGTIAGSVLRLNEAVYNFEKEVALTLEDVISCVTENPAKSLGVYDRKGSLEVGKDADIVLLSDECQVLMTIGKGQILYEK